MKTPQQAAEAIGVNVSTIHNWLKKGYANGRKHDRYWAISDDEVNRLKEWYEERKAAGSIQIPINKQKGRTFKIVGNEQDRTNSEGKVFVPEPRQDFPQMVAKNTPAPRVWDLTMENKDLWRNFTR